jgi:hypothetical protein
MKYESYRSVPDRFSGCPVFLIRLSVCLRPEERAGLLRQLRFLRQGLRRGKNIPLRIGEGKTGSGKKRGTVKQDEYD